MELSKLTEQQLRQKLIDGHTALRNELEDMRHEVMSLMVGYGSALEKSGRTHLAKKNSALTAMIERVTWLTAVLEFIESLGVYDEAKRSSNMKDELRRRYNGVVQSLLRSFVDTRATLRAAHDVTKVGQQTHKMVLLGEQARTKIGSDHAKLMKDLAIVGYLQQFGLKTNLADRQDL